MWIYETYLQAITFQCSPTALYMLFYNVPDVFKRWYCWSWLQTFQLLTPTHLQQSQAVGIFAKCGLTLSPMSSIKKKVQQQWGLPRICKVPVSCALIQTQMLVNCVQIASWMFPFLITQWTWHLWFPKGMSCFDPADHRMVFQSASFSHKLIASFLCVPVYQNLFCMSFRRFCFPLFPFIWLSFDKIACIWRMLLKLWMCLLSLHRKYTDIKQVKLH